MKNDYKIIDQEKFTAVGEGPIRVIVDDRQLIEDMVYGNEKWGTPLKNYAILTYRSDLLKGVELNGLQLHFNRYYWINKFYHEYAKVHGRDHGIEQQIFFVFEDFGGLLDYEGVEELQKVDAQFDVGPG